MVWVIAAAWDKKGSWRLGQQLWKSGGCGRVEQVIWLLRLMVKGSSAGGAQGAPERAGGQSKIRPGQSGAVFPAVIGRKRRKGALASCCEVVDAMRWLNCVCKVSSDGCLLEGRLQWSGSSGCEESCMATRVSRQNGRRRATVRGRWSHEWLSGCYSRGPGRAGFALECRSGAWAVGLRGRAWKYGLGMIQGR